MNMTVTVDKEILEAARSMPRNMGASKLFRHLIRAATYDEKEWAVYKKTEECKRALERLQPFRDRFAK